MSHRESASSPVLVFLGVAFGGSILLSLLIGLSGGHQSSFVGLAPVSMFLPALGVLIACGASGVRFAVEWNRFPARWLPAALLILPFAIHAVALPGVLILEGRLPWDQWLTPGADGLYDTPSKWGWGALSLPALAGRIAVNTVAGLLVVAVVALFEEIGWRAFLLPRLVGRYGAPRGAAASAIVFALWHIPYALSGVQHADKLSPLALALVSPFGHIGAGLFLAWLWLNTRSILLVSLAHGSLNNWGQYAFKFMTTSGERDLALFALVNGALLAVGICAWTRILLDRPAKGANAGKTRE